MVLTCSSLFVLMTFLLTVVHLSLCSVSVIGQLLIKLSSLQLGFTMSFNLLLSSLHVYFHTLQCYFTLHVYCFYLCRHFALPFYSYVKFYFCSFPVQSFTLCLHKPSVVVFAVVHLRLAKSRTIALKFSRETLFVLCHSIMPFSTRMNLIWLYTVW